MNDAQQKMMLAGFAWLATAAALPALAQDLSLPDLGQSASEPSALPPVNGPGPAAPGAETAPPVCYEPYCPPRRLGAIARWRQRCRAHAQDKYWGYPEEFQDAPLGTMVNAHIAASVARGQAARMVLHQFDFFPDSDQLKPRGKTQVAKIGTWLSMNPFPVLVEPSGIDPQLDEARRLAVWHELAGCPCPIPSERVVVAYAPSRGLEGVEAQIIDRNRLSQTAARGVGGGGGGGAGGAGGGSGAAGSSGMSGGGNSYGQ
ncbi:MAG: hypothetical protein EXS05_16485 [Planctomycetaceae bacterium]|nr:hypothetical protein [Planctomycetaceae bacterium]